MFVWFTASRVMPCFLLHMSLNWPHQSPATAPVPSDTAHVVFSPSSATSRLSSPLQRKRCQFQPPSWGCKPPSRRCRGDDGVNHFM